MTPSASSRTWSVVLDDENDICNDDYIIQVAPIDMPPLKHPKVIEVHDLGPYDALELRPILFTSIFLVILQSLQAGWAVSMLNLSTYHDTKDCAVRPIAPGTCVMFPGHSSGDWSWAVNMLSVGGILGSLFCGQVADRLGRKNAFVINATIIVTGGIIQAVAPTIAIFSFGRFVSGLATGAATTLPSGYINEIAPPHRRNKLGVLYSVSVGVGFVLPVVLFFVADTAVGWRCLAAFPVVLAGLFLLMHRHVMVESPTWLLTQGRHDEAKLEIGRLYGPTNVSLAMSWMDTAADSARQQQLRMTSAHGGGATLMEDRTGIVSDSWRQLFAAETIQQTVLVVALSAAQQFSGINAVFFYSSSMFTSAGLADGRVGSLIVNSVNLFPTLFAGALGTRFGNRRMILVGMGLMLVCAVGITVALLLDEPGLSVLFVAGYVASYAISLGPLIFVISAAVFPDTLRASGMSLCLFVNWVVTLLIGVAYPYIAEALGDLGFVPFFVTSLIFMGYLARYLPETAGRTNQEIQAFFHGGPEKEVASHRRQEPRRVREEETPRDGEFVIVESTRRSSSIGWL